MIDDKFDDNKIGNKTLNLATTNSTTINLKTGRLLEDFRQV